MKKIIYSYIIDENCFEIVNHLYKNYSWKPEVIIGPKDLLKTINNDQFNSTRIVDEQKIRNYIFDYKNLKKISIDSELLLKLKKFESNYLSSFKEAFKGSFNLNDRRDYYYNVLTFWNSIINKHKPEIFISYTTPHLEHDYPLYLLCKYIYKIPVIFLEDYPFFNDRFTINNCIEDQSAIFANYALKEKKFINKNVLSFIESFKKSPSFPKYVINEFTYLEKYKIKIKLLNFLKYLYSIIFKNNAYLVPSLKIRKNNTKNINLEISKYIFTEFFQKRAQKKLKNFYQSIAKPTLPEGKFLFFAPSFQPEFYANLRTGIYEDYNLVIDMLISNLPDGWKLVYKEHPYQFIGKYGSLGRTKFFYEKLMETQNIHILRENFNTFEILEKSCGVVSVGGTIGIEALILEKNCILFGNSWYKSCKSVLNVHSNNDCFKAIKMVQEGNKIDKNDILSFLDKIYESSHLNIMSLYSYKIIRNKIPIQIEMNVKKNNYTEEFQKIGNLFYKEYNSLYTKK